MDIALLKAWFLSEKRDLPWRNNPSPYEVWVSEVMLQQTQVNVVIPYFERWMAQFPTLQSLAKASLEEVIKAWEGLGYYSRARNLLQGAKTVQERFNGILPSNSQELQTIKGLGPYTIGALLNFAFKQKAPAIDGNVYRVFSRLFAIEDPIEKKAAQKKVLDAVLAHLPEKEPWIISEAWIELGAKICTKKPKCQQCPLKTSCKAFLRGEAEKFPIKSKKTKITPLFRAVGIITYQNNLLLKKIPEGEVMSGLYEFPYLEVPFHEFQKEALLQEKLSTHLGFPTIYEKSLPCVFHSFTRYKVTLKPLLLNILDPKPLLPPFFWVSKKTISSLAFSSGHRQILSSIIHNV